MFNVRDFTAENFVYLCEVRKHGEFIGYVALNHFLSCHYLKRFTIKMSTRFSFQFDIDDVDTYAQLTGGMPSSFSKTSKASWLFVTASSGFKLWKSIRFGRYLWIIAQTARPFLNEAPMSFIWTESYTATCFCSQRSSVSGCTCESPRKSAYVQQC